MSAKAQLILVATVRLLKASDSTSAGYRLCSVCLYASQIRTAPDLRNLRRIAESSEPLLCILIMTCLAVVMGASENRGP